jgi:septum formation protein
MALILASQSPRRREILEGAGLEFEVRAPDIDERVAAGEDPGSYVRRLARAKAEAVPLPPGSVVLGADTVVVIDGEILGKPADAGEAARMLRRLAGRWHEVVTGICLRAAGGVSVDAETTRVRVAPLTEDEIRLYVASGEPLDKAGGYAIQGLASKFIERIEGCYFNVVGLPMALVYRRLSALAGQFRPAEAPGRPETGAQFSSGVIK